MILKNILNLILSIKCSWYEYEECLNLVAIEKLVQSYFLIDNTEEIKALVNKEQQIKNKSTNEEFYKCFNQLIIHHLENLMNEMIYPFNSKNRATRYLGIDVETLKPYIAIKEGLVGCDVYELDTIIDCYERDKKGKFLFKPSNSELYGKPIVKDNSLIKKLVNFYFDEKEIKTTEGLPLIVKAENNEIPESEYEYVYKGELDRILMSSDILGKFGENKWYDRYIKVPKKLMEIFRIHADGEEKRHKDFEQANAYSRKATNLKKEKNYADAIKWYLKCKALMPNVNIGTARGMFHDLLICYRMVKDKENRALIAQEAHRAFPEELEFEKVFLETSGQLIENSLPQSIQEPKEVIDYGKLYEKEIRLLPEYTFSIKDSPFHKYCKSSNTYKWYISDRKYFKMIEGTTKIQNHFWNIIRKAQAAEALGKIDEAVVLYEQLLAEGYYSTTPFDRITIIYNKNYRTEDLKRVLTKCIKHFKDWGKRQLDYVTSLAEKYDAMKELNKILADRAEIWDWGGNILLYKKYKKVENWEKRLAKLL